ncbi:TPA: hypothetical protein N0F65_011396 [Lagenidium giganteum]|uniref:RNI-like protein n=1 Tax=Lagenidium giganteum TaxID=4803 RepID=A0AAV2ZC20_9STRA|nr:TPA: hypothetical protein N0F65_011396 [Lagenidium giganteum]
MAFRRDVPPLEKLVFKSITKSVRHADKLINDETVERMHRIVKPSKSRSHKVKQEVIRALLLGGRLSDNTLPDSYFHPSMTRLEFIGAKITTKFITRVSKICPKLHTVNLSGCFRLTDDAIEVLLKNCTEIRDLNIENCRKLTDLSLDHMRKLAPKLQSFDVGGNFNMTMAGITKLIEKHPNHSKFHKVHIAGHAVTDQTLKVIMAKCRKLHSISIGYCAVSDDAIMTLLRKRDSVSRLNVHWNTGITDQLLHFVANECPNIQEISFCGVKTITADAIASTINTKMGTGLEHDAAAAAAAGGGGGDQEAEVQAPERKRLKKVDFRYTAVTKELAATLRERHPDLQAIY